MKKKHHSVRHSDHRGTEDVSHHLKTIEPQKKGQKPITFKEGGLHSSTGTAQNKKISASKHQAAREGKLGKKAKQQEIFYENVLKH